MYAQVEKSKENKSKAVANSVGQMKDNRKQGFGFVDNRHEAVAQRKLQRLANGDSKIKYSAHQLPPEQNTTQRMVVQLKPILGKLQQFEGRLQIQSYTSHNWYAILNPADRPRGATEVWFEVAGVGKARIVKTPQQSSTSAPDSSIDPAAASVPTLKPDVAAEAGGKDEGLSPADREELLEFVKDLEGRAQNRGAIRRKLQEFVREGKNLEEVKQALVAIFVPKEDTSGIEVAAAAGHRDEGLSPADREELLEFVKDLEGRAQNRGVIRRKLQEFVREGKSLEEVKQALTAIFVPKEDTTVREPTTIDLSKLNLDRANAVASNKDRVNQHGLNFKEVSTEGAAVSPFSEFMANIQKFFPIKIPPVALEIIASYLVTGVKNEEITKCLQAFHMLPSVFESKPVKIDMNKRLTELMGPRLALLPEFVKAKIETAIATTPATIVDPFHYTFEILKEELHNLQSYLLKEPPSPSACRLTADAITRAINVSSGRFMPNNGKVMGKWQGDEKREIVERIMVHETIHAANKEAEPGIESQLSHIFAEIFTEITANFILQVPPTAYQSFIPIGNQVINHVYGGNMQTFLTAFFSGDMSRVRALFSEEDIENLRRVDGDTGGLANFKGIVKHRLVGS